MAIYSKGKQLQPSGFEKMALSRIPINPSVSDLTFKHVFCFCEANGDSLELIGGAVFTTSKFSDNGWSFGLLELSGYSLDTDRGQVAGNSEAVTGSSPIRYTGVGMYGDILTFYDKMPKGSLPSRGGAVTFDLFFTKQ